MDLVKRRRELLITRTELPNKYKSVEFLQSDANQFIATTYAPVIGDEIETKFSLNTFKTTQVIFSAGTGNNQIILLLQTNFYWKYFQTGAAAVASINKVEDRMYSLAVIKGTNDGKLYIDGSLKASSVISGELDGNDTTLWLFRRRNNSSNFKGKMWKFSITNSGVKKLDLIPCVRKSDNKPGMYDTVSKTFYTNAGKGEFIVPA